MADENPGSQESADKVRLARFGVKPCRRNHGQIFVANYLTDFQMFYSRQGLNKPPEPVISPLEQAFDGGQMSSASARSAWRGGFDLGRASPVAWPALRYGYRFWLGATLGMVPEAHSPITPRLRLVAQWFLVPTVPMRHRLVTAGLAGIPPYLR